MIHALEVAREACYPVLPWVLVPRAVEPQSLGTELPVQAPPSPGAARKGSAPQQPATLGVSQDHRAQWVTGQAVAMFTQMGTSPRGHCSFWPLGETKPHRHVRPWALPWPGFSRQFLCSGLERRDKAPQETPKRLEGLQQREEEGGSSQVTCSLTKAQSPARPPALLGRAGHRDGSSESSLSHSDDKHAVTVSYSFSEKQNEMNCPRFLF